MLEGPLNLEAPGAERDSMPAEPVFAGQRNMIVDEVERECNPADVQEMLYDTNEHSTQDLHTSPEHTRNYG